MNRPMSERGWCSNARVQLALLGTIASLAACAATRSTPGREAVCVRTADVSASAVVQTEGEPGDDDVRFWQSAQVLERADADTAGRIESVTVQHQGEALLVRVEGEGP